MGLFDIIIRKLFGGDYEEKKFDDDIIDNKLWPQVLQFLLDLGRVKIQNNKNSKKIVNTFFCWAGGDKIPEFERIIGLPRLLRYVYGKSKGILSVYVDPTTYKIEKCNLKTLKEIENIGSDEYKKKFDELSHDYTSHFSAACKSKKLDATQYQLILIDINRLDSFIDRTKKNFAKFTETDKVNLNKILSLKYNAVVELLDLCIEGQKIAKDTRNFPIPLYGYQDYVRYVITFMQILLFKLAMHKNDFMKSEIYKEFNELTEDALAYFLKGNNYQENTEEIISFYSDNDIEFENNSIYFNGTDGISAKLKKILSKDNIDFYYNGNSQA